MLDGQDYGGVSIQRDVEFLSRAKTRYQMLARQAGKAYDNSRLRNKPAYHKVDFSKFDANATHLSPNRAACNRDGVRNRRNALSFANPRVCRVSLYAGIGNRSLKLAPNDPDDEKHDSRKRPECASVTDVGVGPGFHSSLAWFPSSKANTRRTAILNLISVAS